MSIFRRERPIEDPGEGTRFGDLDEGLRQLVAEETPYVRRPLTLDQRREQLDKLMIEFARYHDLARKAAQDYLAEHTAVIEALAANRAKVEAHLQNLDKIAAGMPQFGGKDAQASSDPDPNANGNTGTGENQNRSGQELPLAVQRPIPLRPGSPKV